MKVLRMAFPGAGTPQNIIVCAHGTQTGKFVLRGSQGESFEKTPIIERTSFIGLTQTGDESPYYKHKCLGNTRVS